MSGVEATAADRLPWLADEPAPTSASRRRGASVLPLATVAILAGAGLWLGLRSAREQPTLAAHRTPPATTVQLPEARPAQPSEVRLPAEPQVKPVPAPQIGSAPSREVQIALSRAAPAPGKSDAPTSATSAPAPAAPILARRRPRNRRIAAGASGRLVQVGVFGSARQAGRGWRYMVRAYPATARLPAVVRATRNSRGRLFYRLQVGTTSQAHSEVLCQRLQRIRFSCAVVGLPWKAKVER